MIFPNEASNALSATQDPKDDLRQRIVAYLDGELDEGDVEEIERRLISDDRVRGEVDTLQRAWDMLNLLPMPKTKAEFSRQTVELATRSLSRPILADCAPRRAGLPPWIWLPAIAVALVIGGAAVLARAGLSRQIIEDRTMLENLPDYQAAGSADFLKRLEDERLLDQMDELLEPRS